MAGLRFHLSQYPPLPASIPSTYVVNEVPHERLHARMLCHEAISHLVRHMSPKRVVMTNRSWPGFYRLVTDAYDSLLMCDVRKPPKPHKVPEAHSGGDAGLAYAINDLLFAIHYYTCESYRDSMRSIESFYDDFAPLRPRSELASCRQLAAWFRTDLPEIPWTKDIGQLAHAIWSTGDWSIPLVDELLIENVHPDHWIVQTLLDPNRFHLPVVGVLWLERLAFTDRS